MKFHIQCLLVTLALFVAFGSARSQEVGVPDEPRTGNSRVSAGAGSELDFQRWRWAYERRADPVKGIPSGAYLRAFEQIQTSKKGAARPAYSTENSQLWASIGPSPLLGGQILGPVPPDVKVSGRVGGIAVDPSNSNHWFIAAAGGGIWETPDAGVSWTPKTDDQPSLEMGALAMAPGNPSVLYGGTGNYGAYVPTGIGILRSTNGGLNWTFVAPSAFTNVDYFNFIAIIISPSNTSVLLSATSDFFGPTPSSGIFKSTDGATTWSQRQVGVGTALVANPGNFNLQFAGLRTIYGSDDPSNGVYRTFDAGDTWQKLDGPWGVVANAGNPILLALPPTDTNVAYVCISGQALWRSTNAWAAIPSWTQFALPQAEPTPSLLGADGTDSTVLYAGGVKLWRLNGTNWTDITGSTHVDQHAMAWTSNKLILGNDGGLWTSVNGGNSWSNHNAQLGTIQFYRGSLHPTNANFALGGSQDNGEVKWLGGSTWQFIFGGDDFSSAIANVQPDLRWAISYYYLGILRTLDGGTNFVPADGGIDNVNRPFYSLFVKSPVNDDLFITATTKLWKTTNFFSGATVLWFTNGPDMGSAITAMAFAPSNPSGNTYAYGAQRGFFDPGCALRLTINGGATWNDINAANLVPNRTVTGLAFAQSNANVLYVTLSGFDDFGPAGHVFKTTNALSAKPVWTNISPPVNLPHNSVVTDGQNGEAVFVGTDMGVWRSGNGGGNWTHMGPEVGMPNVVVNDLQLNPPTGRLVAFTYGRGAFALVNSTNVADLSFTSIQISGSDVLLTFKSVLGRNYLVRGTDNLTPASWFTVAASVPGTGNPVTVRDAGKALQARRFYRVSTP